MQVAMTWHRTVMRRSCGVAFSRRCALILPLVASLIWALLRLGRAAPSDSLGVVRQKMERITAIQTVEAKTLTTNRLTTLMGNL